MNWGVLAGMITYKGKVVDPHKVAQLLEAVDEEMSSLSSMMSIVGDKKETNAACTKVLEIVNDILDKNFDSGTIHTRENSYERVVVVVARKELR